LLRELARLSKADWFNPIPDKKKIYFGYNFSDFRGQSFLNLCYWLLWVTLI
jgi:hypothetical protein